MTDRELLELAAKAAGMKYMKFTVASGLYGMLDPSRPEKTGSIGEPWNPLTSDGDALRLAVKLELHIRPYRKHVDVCAESRNGDVIAEYGEDRAASTRRAIVRAAAEIGKGMK